MNSNRSQLWLVIGIAAIIAAIWLWRPHSGVMSTPNQTAENRASSGSRNLPSDAMVAPIGNTVTIKSADTPNTPPTPVMVTPASRFPSFGTPYVSPNFPDGRAFAQNAIGFLDSVPPKLREMDILYQARSARSNAEEQWLIQVGFPTDPQLHELSALNLQELTKRANEGNVQAMIALAQRLPNGIDPKAEYDRRRWYSSAIERGSLYAYWAAFDDHCRAVNCLSVTYKTAMTPASKGIGELATMRGLLYDLLVRGDDKALAYLTLLPTIPAQFSIYSERRTFSLAFSGLRRESRANDFPTKGILIYPRPRSIPNDFY
jgi:hypothetical protein